MIADSRIHLDALRAQFRASLAVQFQYRASQVIWLLFFVLNLCDPSGRHRRQDSL